MKTRTGVIIFVFLIGMILCAVEPALLYGAETPEGNVWDFVLDPKPFPGKSLTGPISIYYDVTSSCGDYDYTATMYYTVRILKTKEKENGKIKETFYTFQGFKGGICLNTDITGQGNEIRRFLGEVVVPGIFPNGFKSWKWKSITNAQFHDDAFSRAFVADIEIVVDKK